MDSSSKEKQEASSAHADAPAGQNIGDYIASPNLQVKILINKDAPSMSDEAKKYPLPPQGLPAAPPAKDEAPRKMPKLPIKPPAGLTAVRKDADEDDNEEQGPTVEQPDGPYLCTECTKSFTSMAALKKHQRIHLERRYLCKECGNSFFDNSKLKRHMLVHTQIKTFTCPVPNCRKKFSLAYNLKSHVKAHNRIGDKFKCEVCLQVFLQAFQLNRHRVTAHMPSDVQPPADLYQAKRRQRTSMAQARRKRPKIEPLPVGTMFPGVMVPNLGAPADGKGGDDEGDETDPSDKDEEAPKGDEGHAAVAVSGSPMIRPADASGAT